MNAHSLLIDHIASLLGRTPPEASGCILRAQTAIEDVSPRLWLAAQSTAQRCYWAERVGVAEVAGIGSACEVAGAPAASQTEAVARCVATLAVSSPGVRFLGGFRFAPNARTGRPWDFFQSYRFIVPRIECAHTADGTSLACNILWASGMRREDVLAALAAELRALRPPVPANSDHMPVILRRCDLPAFPEWRSSVENALGRCVHGTLRKAVLARKTELALARPIDACELLDRLASDHAPLFVFLFQRAPDDAFLGASPELLYRREGRALWAEALAGTYARDNDPARDAALGRALLGDDKELAEHRLVSTTLHADLGALCREVTTLDHEQLMLLPYVQHIVTRFRGILHEGVDDGTILSRLHPTAAVGGDPRSVALDTITALEHFDRGWYAAPVGWIMRDACEFAVAIRSAHVGGDVLTLFSGAGIVPGSDPSREWNENERKLAPFLKALNGNGRRS